MPGFNNFFALNQNNSTTTTYGDIMGSNSNGDMAYSYYFKPFHFSNPDQNDTTDNLLLEFYPSECHYVEILYTIHREVPNSPPSSNPSMLFFKTILGFNDDGVFTSRDTIQYLSDQPGPDSILVFNTSNIISNIKIVEQGISGIRRIYLVLPLNKTVGQGIYQYA
jgi:hypothetical protein